MYICDNPPEMTDQPQPQRTKVSVFSRIRRSFRRKKESYCINCGHVTKNCYHSKDIYENVEFNNKDDLLKWLDLDLSHGHGINNNPIRLKYQVTGGSIKINFNFSDESISLDMIHSNSAFSLWTDS